MTELFAHIFAPKPVSAPAASRTSRGGYWPARRYSRASRAVASRWLYAGRLVAAAPLTLAVLLLAGALVGLSGVGLALVRLAEWIAALQRRILPPSSGAGPTPANHGPVLPKQSPGDRPAHPDDAAIAELNRLKISLVRAIDWRREGGTADVIPFHKGLDIRSGGGSSAGKGGNLTGGDAA